MFAKFKARRKVAEINHVFNMQYRHLPDMAVSYGKTSPYLTEADENKYVFGAYISGNWNAHVSVIPFPGGESSELCFDLGRVGGRGVTAPIDSELVKACGAAVRHLLQGSILIKLSLGEVTPENLTKGIEEAAGAFRWTRRMLNSAVESIYTGANMAPPISPKSLDVVSSDIRKDIISADEFLVQRLQDVFAINEEERKEVAAFLNEEIPIPAWLARTRCAIT